jgi:hypothetical protein
MRQMDVMIAKRVGIGRGPNVELRAEIFNIFNITNFANPVGTLPNALPNTALTEANRCSRHSRSQTRRPARSVV